jgi:hypothetical protein
LSEPTTGSSVTLTAPTSNSNCEENAVLELVKNAGTSEEVVVDSLAVSYNCSTYGKNAYIDVLTRDSICEMPEAYCKGIDYSTSTLYNWGFPSRLAYNFKCDGTQGVRSNNYWCSGAGGVHYEDCSKFKSFCAERNAYCDELQAPLPVDTRTDAMKQAGCCPAALHQYNLDADN